jgi:hypothetical protein
MRLALLASLIVLCSCGKKPEVSPPSPNPTYREALELQIARIEPQLYFKDGVVSKQNNDIGDAGLHHALFASVTTSPDLLSAYTRVPESVICRSYDMWLGTQIMQVYGVPQQYDCPDLQKNKEFLLQKNLTALEAKAAAETMAPGFRLHLLASRVYLLALQNNLTDGWVDVAARMYRRDPANPYFNFVDNLVHSGSASRYEEAAATLLPRMAAWDGVTRTQWSVERDTAEEAWKDDAGHSLVFVARLLLKSQW